MVAGDSEDKIGKETNKEKKGKKKRPTT